MHIDLFGKQLCGRKDNDILPGEHIRNNVQPDGRFQKQTPSGRNKTHYFVIISG